MFQKMLKSLKRAFTITELVIVIAVIAILAAILIPTFSSVIESSKKSSDQAYAKEINQAISSYAAQNGGVMPDNYNDLMKVLKTEGLTDATNYFLLAKELEEDDAYLIWYPTGEYTSSVSLICESDGYVVTYFSGSAGGVTENYGNGVSVADELGNVTYGYKLLVYGNSNDQICSSMLQSIYVTYSGSVSAYLSNNTNYTEGITDSTWATVITIALKNADAGYSYSSDLASNISSQLSTSTTAYVDLTKNDSGETITDTETITSNVMTAMATLSGISAGSNSTANSSSMAGKTVTLQGVDGVTADMSGVTFTAIGTSYRKDSDYSDTATSYSVDFGGLILENFTISKNSFVSTGANWQTDYDLGRSSDKNVTTGGYAYTFGIFGSVIGGTSADTAVTYSNLKVQGINIDLNGSTETISGTTYDTLTDMAGVICGFTKGYVNFENIDVIGSTGSKNGSISGYDAVAGIVGRCYALDGVGTVTLDDCNVSNLDINGQRRAFGLVGYLSSVDLVITDCSVTNCNMTAKQTYGTEQAMAGIICNSTGDTIYYNSFSYSDCTVSASYLNASGYYISVTNYSDYYTCALPTSSTETPALAAVDGGSTDTNGAPYYYTNILFSANADVKLVYTISRTEYTFTKPASTNDWGSGVATSNS